MEELLELTRKQLRLQRIITGILAVMVILLLVAGVGLVNQMNEMSAAMNDAVAKMQEIDVDAINSTIYGTQEMVEGMNAYMTSMNEYVTSLNEMSEQAEIFDNWLDEMFGRQN